MPIHLKPRRPWPQAIEAIPGLDRSRCCSSAAGNRPRAAPGTMQMVGERLGITDSFRAWTRSRVHDDGSFEILERVEGGRHQVSVCASAPALLGWATGQPAGTQEQSPGRHGEHAGVMPALQRAKAYPSVTYGSATFPRDAAQTAARDAHREGHAGRRNRARNRGVDGGGITTWKTFSSCAHGSRWNLGKAAWKRCVQRWRWAAGDRRTDRHGHAGSRRPDCGLRRSALPGRDRRSVRTAPLCHRCGGR